ncbi:MAG: hypothetical protein H7039_05925 [Bryobacteraceae bacterium]|nr:hypothetical protein [Bryobacteraceae bacterium]
MTLNLIRVATIAGLLSVAGTSAFAQHLTGKVPFDFKVSSVTMPAGSYEFLRQDNSLAWVLRNAETGQRSMVVPAYGGVARRVDAERDRSVLVFRCVGRTCALASLFNAGSRDGIGFPVKLPNVTPDVQVATLRIALSE